MSRILSKALCGLVATAALAGCGQLHVRAGAKPEVARLQSLRVGDSREQEVRTVLGNPDGQGRSMLPWQGAPRTVWTYYYEEGLIDLGGGSSDDRRMFLFVFLEQGRFDGYLWFSSLKSAP